MRTKSSIDKLASVTSTMLYEVGNSLNLSLVLKNRKPTLVQIIMDDKKALANDWNQVGKEVKVAIDRFEKEYPINHVGRIGSRTELTFTRQ